jgi:cytochrome P450
MTAFELGARIRIENLEADPYPILARLQELEPVSWCESLGGWLVTDYELAREVLNDERRFTAGSESSMNQRILGTQMLNLDAEPHRRQRAPFNPHLHFRPVQEHYADLIERIADELVDGFAHLGVADLRASFARVLPIRVSALVLGLAEDAGAFSAWYDDFSRALSNFEHDPAVDARARLSNEALRRRVLADLRSPAPDSIISHVCAADAGGLNDDELVNNIAIILFGGIETTEASILNTLWALLAEPEPLAEVGVRPELVENAVDEALRWEAPTQIVDRWAIDATWLGDIPIERGDWINVMIGAVNRDPHRFSEPDRYDIHRDNARRHMAFGYGPHSCIGLNLAKLEAQTAIRVLLARIPGLRFHPSPGEPPRGIAFRKPPRLDVTWDAALTSDGSAARPTSARIERAR